MTTDKGTPRDFDWHEELCGLVAGLVSVTRCHSDEFSVNHAVMLSMMKEIDQLQSRVERLEKIILALAPGCETSWPDSGHVHNHWVYPMNGSMEEIRRLRKEV